MIPHTLSSTNLTVLGPDFMPKTIPHTHPAWDEIVEALRTDDQTKVFMLIDLPAAVVDYMQGAITIADRVLFFNERPLDTALTRRILQFMETGQPELANPLIEFLKKVMQNPSHHAVQGLFEWVERSGLPITETGNILGYKIVREDFLDIYTGKFDHSVGKIVQVERWEVDDNPDRTCSYGIHFCSPSYLPHYGSRNSTTDRVMVVEVNPADVVAFPRDYNTSKGRCCRLEVIGEVPAAKAKDFFPNRYVSGYRQADHGGYDALDAEVEIGARYLTRDGRIAEIVDTDDDDTYPVNGYVVGGGEVCWTLFGSYNGDEEHPLDLVELLPENYVPTAAPAVPEAKPVGWLGRLFGTGK